MRTTIRDQCLVPGLAEATSSLLIAMRENFKHKLLQAMLEEIDRVIDQDTRAHKQAFLSRTQHCFAVQNGADGFLDVARATFCRLTEEIHMLVASYRHQTGLNIKVTGSLADPLLCSKAMLFP